MIDIVSISEDPHLFVRSKNEHGQYSVAVNLEERGWWGWVSEDWKAPRVLTTTKQVYNMPVMCV